MASVMMLGLQTVPAADPTDWEMIRCWFYFSACFVIGIYCLVEGGRCIWTGIALLLISLTFMLFLLS